MRYEYIFAGAIVGFFFFALITKNQNWKDRAEEVLVTAALVGCLASISIALFHFDPSNPIDSITAFLGDIRFGFILSLTGLGCKLAMGIANGLRKTLTHADINLGHIQDTLLGNQTRQIEQFDRLNKTLEDFAKRLAEDSTKAIVAALESVVKDFNKNLTEQFGENFKQLNLAVGDLVVWQRQYKDELNTLQQKNSQITESLGNTTQHLLEISKSLDQLSGSATNFTQKSEQLTTLIYELEKQYALIVQGQESLTKTLSAYEGLPPAVNQKIESMITQLQDGATNLNKTVTEGQEKATGATVKATEELKNNLVSLDKQIKSNLDSTMNRFGQQLADIIENMALQISDIKQRLSNTDIR
jgi:ABC-type transporter Mla subunit MlaD